jgi:hypothetical protein
VVDRVAAAEDIHHSDRRRYCGAEAVRVGADGEGEEWRVYGRAHGQALLLILERSPGTVHVE